jgi:predicted MPP superfamily phosphohydrolase
MEVAVTLELALALGVGLGIPVYAWWARGRTYAGFAAVVLALSLPAALVLHLRLRVLAPGPEWVAWLDAGFSYALAATGIHLAFLVRARLRGRLFRYGISLPGMSFLAMGALAGPWLLALLPVRGLLSLAGADPLMAALRWLDVAPLVVVVFGVVHSMRLRREIVRVHLPGVDGPRPAQVTRLPVERYRRRQPAALPERPLRIVQITDPHLGPFQPVHRLRRRIERLLDHEPDLVLLTGDFLTMEGHGSPGALEDALEPLRTWSGRSYACFGNHDHEAPAEVRQGLLGCGVTLLVDEEATVETPLGPVQILGADHHFEKRREQLEQLLARHPRKHGQLRLLLLHDPLRFELIPPGEVDLTFSGHTHGGQVGLVSFGLDWTVLSRSRWPDHGLFGHGSNRLYVHRGTGFYGFPLRIGVPGEASLLELVPAGS